MPESFVQVAADGAGKRLRTRERTVNSQVIQEQFVVVQDEKVITYRGIVPTFRQLGRNPAAGAVQPLLSIWNGSATNLVDVQRIVIDAYSTAGRLIAVAPPIARLYRITAAPTTGQTLTKAPLGRSDQTSDAAVVIRGDSTADGANAATALAVTLGAMITQEMMSRYILWGGTTATAAPAAAGTFEPADRIEFLNGEPDLTLRPSEGLALVLVAPTTNSVPTTDNFTAAVSWTEYTTP